MLAVDADAVVIWAERDGEFIVRLLALARWLFADREISHAEVRRLGLALAERQAAGLRSDELQMKIVTLPRIPLPKLAH